jgi:protein-disulfide isomerase
MKRVSWFLFWLVLLSSGISMAQTSTFSTPQEDEIRRIVRDYLRRHPELIIEALEQAEEARKEREAQEQAAAVKRLRADVMADSRVPSFGPADADVTIVEFFDYRCPYCKRMQPAMIELLRSDRRVRVLYRELPILGPDSVAAARAALAAHRQGAYRRFHDRLMAVREPLDERLVYALAREESLDVDKLHADARLPEIQEQIERNLAMAEALKIRGTPALIIGEQFVPGAVDLDSLRRLVANARKR